MMTTTDRIFLALVGQSTLFNEGLRRLLDDEDFTIGAEAPSADALVRLGPDGEPRIVILHLRRDGEGIPHEVERLRQGFPDSAIVVLAPTFSVDQLRDCLQAGARGFLLEDISAEALRQSFRLVLAGEAVLPTELTETLLTREVLPESPPLAPPEVVEALSERELDILRSLTSGFSNKEIAKDLGITEATVKVHMKAILRKVGLENRTQAAIWAYNNGIVQET